MDTNTQIDTQTSRFWVWALTSAALAIIFDYLFFNKIFGISVTIYGVLVLGALFWFSKVRGYSFKPAGWLVPIFLFFCLMPAIRASSFLTFLNSLAALGTFLLIIRAVAKDDILNFRFLDYILTAILWPFKFFRRGLVGFMDLVRGAKSSPSTKTRQIATGVLTAIPVLLFFGVLFSFADLAFRKFLADTFAIHFPATMVPQIIIMVIVFLGCLGLFVYLLNPTDKVTGDIANLINFDIDVFENRKVEIAVFLSLIAALFLLFIVFQVHYLFGGVSNITYGPYTYAEYARKGFGELLVVAAATLLILFAIDSKLEKVADRKKWFLIPSLIIIVEVMVIMASAFKRLVMYQSAYSLTLQRLYVFAIIFFLATIFIILAVKIFQNKKHSFFAFGVLLSVMAVIIGLNFLNPDKFVARKNIDQFSGTDKLDMAYLQTLSADAVPVILDGTHPNADYKNQLLKNVQGVEKSATSWQSFNLARKKAISSLQP